MTDDRADEQIEAVLAELWEIGGLFFVKARSEEPSRARNRAVEQAIQKLSDAGLLSTLADQDAYNDVRASGVRAAKDAGQARERAERADREAAKARAVTDYQRTMLAEVRAEVERLRGRLEVEPQFHCITHMCGGCAGCRAHGIEDENTRLRAQRDEAQDERALLRAQVATVRALHREVVVYDIDDGQVEQIILDRFCAHCSSDEALDAVEDGDWKEGWYEQVSYPCPTIRALDTAGGEQ